jgi:cell wall-associated NlpC family hydrolase
LSEPDDPGATGTIDRISRCVLNSRGAPVELHRVPSRSLFPRGRRAGVAALVAATLTVGLVPLGAGAAPEPGTTGPSAVELEQVAEQYNLARVEVERASALIAATTRTIQIAETRVATVQDRIRARAAALYQRQSAGSPLPIVASGDYDDQVRHRKYLEAAEVPDQELADALSDELAQLHKQERAQRDARDMLQQDADRAARLQRRLEAMASAAAARRSLGTGDGAGPVGATATTVTATGTGNATTTTAPRGTAPVGRPTTPPSAPSTPPSSPPSSPPPTGNPAPPSSRAATAIAYARAQLGKPYVFAAAGPNAFDCSGLTMAAWAAAGVRMPHYSGSQATMFPKVSWDQLQPGDIVVFYSDLHHVGLYIGGGMMIHAPQTGDVVKIAPAWRTTFQWGVRPG